ncbi:hypothetical protein [Spiroplasma endosymbiont of Crioceris asparagi]|uniref:hypothetical protein n=1 Tax=Spiroplasma endosymbiont of Crioceris asparagi TaxID=3066286 RepID=UPI0030D2619A
MKDEFFLENIRKSKQDGNLHHAFFVCASSQEHLNVFAKNLINEILSYKNSDLNIIEITNQGNNISKESIQKMIKKFSNTTIEEDAKKIYVIKNVEDLSLSAANSLLKFLEEPAKNTYAILLSKNGGNVLDTLVSRCMNINLTNAASENNNNKLIDAFKNSNKNEILLYSMEAKNLDKNIITEQLEAFYDQVVKINFIDRAGDYLDDLDIIKKMPKNISLVDAMLIKIYEVM